MTEYEKLIFKICQEAKENMATSDHDSFWMIPLTSNMVAIYFILAKYQCQVSANPSKLRWLIYLISCLIENAAWLNHQHPQTSQTHGNGFQNHLMETGLFTNHDVQYCPTCRIRPAGLQVIQSMSYWWFRYLSSMPGPPQSVNRARVSKYVAPSRGEETNRQKPNR